jgi:polyhydroxyalkanoic acid synthase PhaR subunit
MKGMALMSEETNRQKPGDPMEVWEQWYEAASKGWSNSTNGNAGKTSSPNPFSLYRTWLQGVTRAMEQSQQGTGNPLELWKRWFEATADSWRKAVEISNKGGDSLGLMKQWLDMMDAARAGLLAGMTLPIAPFTFFKQWYDATNETLSAAIGDVIGSDKFMEVSSEFLNDYANLYALIRRTNEDYLHNLQLPTRTDIARVAELLINLEDKVDRIENQLEDVADDAGHGLSQLDDVQQRLAAVESLEQRVGQLEQRLNGIESKLDTLLAAIATLPTRTTEPVKVPSSSRRANRTADAQRQKSQKSQEAEAQAAS